MKDVSGISQKQFWNDFLMKSDIKNYSGDPTTFAQEVIKYFPSHSTVLELGCGFGNDAVFFAQQEHTVIATDFSDTAIHACEKRFNNIPNLKFQYLDMTKPFPFKENSIDIIYARLSLHYFTHMDTHLIFQEIAKVLKLQGKLCFMCKSPKDYWYGIGEKLENDMYIENNHIRHFFSEDYVHNLLDKQFSILLLDENVEKIYSRENSAAIKVVAQKIA